MPNTLCKNMSKIGAYLEVAQAVYPTTVGYCDLQLFGKVHDQSF